MAKLYRGLVLNDIAAILIVLGKQYKYLLCQMNVDEMVFDCFVCPCTSSHPLVCAEYLKISHFGHLGAYT